MAILDFLQENVPEGQQDHALAILLGGIAGGQIDEPDISQKLGVLAGIATFAPGAAASPSGFLPGFGATSASFLSNLNAGLVLASVPIVGQLVTDAIFGDEPLLPESNRTILDSPTLAKQLPGFDKLSDDGKIQVLAFAAERGLLNGILREKDAPGDPFIGAPSRLDEVPRGDPSVAGAALGRPGQGPLEDVFVSGAPVGGITSQTPGVVFSEGEGQEFRRPISQDVLDLAQLAREVENAARGGEVGTTDPLGGSLERDDILAILAGRAPSVARTPVRQPARVAPPALPSLAGAALGLPPITIPQPAQISVPDLGAATRPGGEAAAAQAQAGIGAALTGARAAPVSPERPALTPDDINRIFGGQVRAPFAAATDEFAAGQVLPPPDIPSPVPPAPVPLPPDASVLPAPAAGVGELPPVPQAGTSAAEAEDLIRRALLRR